MEEKDIASYYDQFSKDRQKLGINRRHRLIFRKLKQAGLKPHHRILEIGCGPGQVTSLLAPYMSNGKVVATDISPEAIALAKIHLGKYKQVEYMVTDMSDFSYSEKFDFVLLPDVLEHIPEDDHKSLFATLAQHIHENSVIAINFPYPYALEWMHKYDPSDLQVIDQPLYTDKLLPRIYDNGLFLYQLQSYSIRNNEPEYQWLIVKPYVEMKKPTPRPPFKKFIEGILARF